MHFASFGGGSWHLVLQLVIVGQNVQGQPDKKNKNTCKNTCTCFHETTFTLKLH